MTSAATSLLIYVPFVVPVLRLSQQARSRGTRHHVNRPRQGWEGSDMAARRLGLAVRRRAQGYSQDSLAEQLRVSRSTVARWERGETEPQPHVRPKLATLLDVSREELAELLTIPAAVPGHQTKGSAGAR
jgi:ribosome-binding protein aMBF1 (putative translation factor)